MRVPTALGPVDIELLDTEAPATVANYLRYLRAGAYNNTFFHRSVPGFVVALFLIQVFAVELGWLPSTGMHDVRESYEGWRAVRDVGEHLVLPTIALSAASIARWARYQRSSLLDVLTQDYIRTARAKGARERRVLRVHALRNALLPMITIGGLSIPQLVSGAFIIEFVFGWPGMGRRW